MTQKIRNLYSPTNLKRKLLFIFFDIVAFAISISLTLEVYNELNPFPLLNSNLFILLLTFIPVKILVFYYFRLYDISWKFVSLQDLANIAKASILSNGILFIVVYGFNLPVFKAFPRGILLIDLVFSFLFSSGFKISKRMYLEVVRKNLGIAGLKKTLIIGAGSSGEQLLREINRSQPRVFFPIGFIDDDPLKTNLYLQGVRVMGTTEDLPNIIRENNIESILISILTVDRKFHRKILNVVRDCGVTDVKVVSAINDISNNIKISLRDIRDIEVSDLIGRQAVSINTQQISTYLHHKRILITGAAGSIGSEISRQVIRYKPEKIAILDINESDLADLELQLKRLDPELSIQLYICDISNRGKVEKIFAQFSPDVVFHAAAYKHVPVMEKFPEEAVRVNILGTHNLAQAAKLSGVENFVLISTDKAVNPTSIMGVTKRIAEYIVTGAGKNSTSNFVAVRFGNVIGSRGSALPIFIEQLKNGGPITITHPEMKRYFMTIPESVALVLQAGATGNNGDVFVLDMGEPIKIVDLVRDLILLNNLVPDKDIKIEFTGIREGEKLFEEVLTAEEGVVATNHEKIFKARMVCLHDEQVILNMVQDFNARNGHTTKEEWKLLFKSYVNTFNPSLEEQDPNEDYNVLKSLDMPVESKQRKWN